MKDVIKNYKSVIAVYAITFVVSLGVTWYYFSVKTKINELKAQKDKIAADNKEVEGYTYEVKNDENVNLQKKNTDQRLDELKKIKAERINNFSEGLEVKIDVAPTQAKQLILFTVERVIKELKKQQVEIDPKEELSFLVTRNDILKKGGAEIQVALQQLNYVEHVVKSAANAGIEKVLSIKRPKDLVISVEKDKSLPWEFHSFQFKFAGSPDAIKKLINQLSNEKGFYSRVTYVEIKGQGSLTDIVPTFKFPDPLTPDAAQSLAPAGGPDPRTLDAAQTLAFTGGPRTPNGAQTLAPTGGPGPRTPNVAQTLAPTGGPKEEVKAENAAAKEASTELQKLATNPLAFDKPKVEAEINVDWIIFKKDQKGK